MTSSLVPLALFIVFAFDCSMNKNIVAMENVFDSLKNEWNFF
jgi:hypothetical protein